MSEAPTAKTIATETHGRYLVHAPPQGGAAPVLVGFHGYMEHAERHLAALRRIAGADDWLIVAVQGLHRFYDPKHQSVVASWMTSQDRELAIADNLAYVGAVIDQVTRDHDTARPFVYAGFSQGVAMAYRAATQGRGQGVIALAGDVPPELKEDQSITWPAVLVGRGTGDTWYTQAKMDMDLAFLRTTGARVDSIVFDGAHEWTEPFTAAAGRFLASVR